MRWLSAKYCLLSSAYKFSHLGTKMSSIVTEHWGGTDWLIREDGNKEKSIFCRQGNKNMRDWWNWDTKTQETDTEQRSAVKMLTEITQGKKKGVEVDFDRIDQVNSTESPIHTGCALLCRLAVSWILTWLHSPSQAIFTATDIPAFYFHCIRTVKHRGETHSSTERT